MNELALFNYADQQVRVISIAGEPWFVLGDLCRVLGISDVSIVRRRLDDGVCQTHPITDSLGRNQQATIVNEPGMYEVVIRSDKPEAVAFRRWITTEVLPQIRKTGSYGKQLEIPSHAEALRGWADALEQAEREQAARIEAETRARELEAPASAWEHMASSKGDYAVGDAAKALSRDPKITIGRTRLFRFMQAEGWIYRDHNLGALKAYQTQIDNGRLTEKLNRPYLNERTGEMEVPAPTIRVTPKGLAELHKRLGGSQPPAPLGQVA